MTAILLNQDTIGYMFQILHDELSLAQISAKKYGQTARLVEVKS